MNHFQGRDFTSTYFYFILCLKESSEICANTCITKNKVGQLGILVATTHTF